LKKCSTVQLIQKMYVYINGIGMQFSERITLLHYGYERHRIKGISSEDIECRNCAYIQFTMCIYGCIGDNYKRFFQYANQRTVLIFYIV
jgi:hypothetical protein